MDTFHGWDGDYLTRRDWPDAPSTRKRVALALGDEPIPNARYLLPPIPLPDWARPIAEESPALTEAEQFAMRVRWARSVELRLLPTGRRFAARAVWRAAYALGLVWGDMDLFHWSVPSADGGQRVRLFTLSAWGEPGCFLPERAAEGETVAGLVFSFELPTNPAPVVALDRMAVALDYFRQIVGGQAIGADGTPLDYDGLLDERDAVAEMVGEMTGAGLPPGSPQAARFF